MILHDYECAEHGIFECSHGLCPALGCDSSSVKKIHLKPPGLRSDKTKATDMLASRLGNRYGLTDLTGDDTGGAKAVSVNPEDEFRTRAVAPQEMHQYFGHVKPTFQNGMMRPTTGVVDEVKPMLGNNIPTRVIATGTGVIKDAS